MRRIFFPIKLSFFLILIFFVFPVLAERQIEFAGYNWQVKDGYYGPGPNYWNNSKKAVYKDKKKRLCLEVKKRNNIWQSAEVSLKKSLGYGVYKFTLNKRPGKIDRNLVLGMFLYQDDEHEIDIELSRWGEKKHKNLYFTVQPHNTEGNQKTYYLALENRPSKYIINWQRDKIIFSVKQHRKIIKQWEYQGSYNFLPGNERVHINFWQYENRAPFRNKKQEIIIEDFIFKKN